MLQQIFILRSEEILVQNRPFIRNAEKLTFDPVCIKLFGEHHTIYYSPLGGDKVSMLTHT